VERDSASRKQMKVTPAAMNAASSQTVRCMWIPMKKPAETNVSAGECHAGMCDENQMTGPAPVPVPLVVPVVPVPVSAAVRGAVTSTLAQPKYAAASAITA
jgi:hypothetical protein